MRKVKESKEQASDKPLATVTEIKSRDQGELPGVVPAQIKRLRDIEDEMEEIDGKIGQLRKDKKKLNGEAVAIVEQNKLEDKTQVRGSNEWYTEIPDKKYKRRRFKVTKEDGKKAKKAS